MFAFSLTVTIDYNEAKFILNLIRLGFHNLFEINWHIHNILLNKKNILNVFI